MKQVKRRVTCSICGFGWTERGRGPSNVLCPECSSGRRIFIRTSVGELIADRYDEDNWEICLWYPRFHHPKRHITYGMQDGVPYFGDNINPEAPFLPGGTDDLVSYTNTSTLGEARRMFVRHSTLSPTLVDDVERKIVSMKRQSREEWLRYER